MKHLRTAWIVVSSIALGLVVSAFLAVFAEGALSFASVAREFWHPRPAAEHSHSRFDAELGWSNRPDFRDPDFYGPAQGLSTNSRGFRGARETAARPARGSRRLVCSGDSFTLGYGVSDGETWPARLETLEPGWETVNLGEGGYGVDQSYLRYERDAAGLAHDVHALAFIYADFERMRAPSFFGVPRPVLEEREGRLIGLPVAEAPLRVSPLASRLVALHRLRVVRALETAARKLFLRVDDRRVRELSLRVFEELDRSAHERGARFLAIYLPTEMDAGPTRLDEFRAFLSEELGRRGIAFLDLTSAFRQAPEAARETFFLSGEEARHLGADGHYSAAGNDWIARAVLAALERRDGTVAIEAPGPAGTRASGPPESRTLDPRAARVVS